MDPHSKGNHIKRWGMGHGVFKVCDDLSVCYAHEGKTHKTLQVLTAREGQEKFLPCFGQGSNLHQPCFCWVTFTVQCAKAPDYDACSNKCTHVLSTPQKASVAKCTKVQSHVYMGNKIVQ